MPVDVSEMRALAKKMRRAAAVAPRRASTVIRKGLLDIQRLAQLRVAVDTGTLKNSIGVEMGAGALEGVVGPTAAYGGYVEFGTSKMGAQPYMNPSADRVIPKVAKALEMLGTI